MDAFNTDSYFQKQGLYYRPTLTLSLMLDASIGGKEPFIYHLSNLIFHILSCVILIFILNYLSRNQSDETNSEESYLKNSFFNLFTVAFFAVSPLLLNSVAWIPGRNDILLTIFFLLSFFLYIKFYELGKIILRELHLIFFIFALFSKETAIILPIIFLIYSLLIKKNNLFRKVNIATFVCWIIILFFYFDIRSNVVLPLENINTLLNNFIYNLPLIPELLGKFFIPVNLTGIPGYSTFNIISGILILLIMIAMIILRKNNRNYMLFGLLWIIITILPGMFASRGSTNFDYLECRAYLPMVGVVIYMFYLLKSFELSYTLKTISITVILIYSAVNFFSSSIYANPSNFYDNAVKKNPKSVIAHNNRALILQSKGKIREAIREFEKAIKSDKKFAEVYFNLGSLLDRVGNINQAEILYTVGLKIKKDSPKVYYMRANIKIKQGDTISAINDFYSALKYDSTESRAYFGLASIQFHKGNINNSISLYSKAIKINNKYAQAYFNRAVCYTHLKLFDNAIKDYNTCEKMDSLNHNLYHFRGNIKLMMGDTSAACLDWYKAAKLGNQEVPRLISLYCH
jgi:tetratricopeptide (TPR) repeat protein